MVRIMSSWLMAVFWLGHFATPLHAEKATTDWKAIMTGVDGVIVYCLAAPDRDYAEQLCGKLSQTAIAAFEGSGIKAIHSGVVYTGVDAKQGHPTDPAPFKQASGMTQPLVIRLLIKGTKSNNPGVAYATTISRPFRAALEAGGSGRGLAGDLVVYERHWVAEGPRRKVIGFLGDFGTKQLRELVAEIRAGM